MMKSLLTAALVLTASAAAAQPPLLPTLMALRQEYPTPMDPAQVGELLTRTARSAPGWFLLRKETGFRCPAMGTEVSCDYLVYQDGRGFDVLTDVDGAAAPTWPGGPSGIFPPDRLVAVGMAPPAPPPPSFPSPAVDLGPLHTDHAALLALLAQLEARTLAGHDSLRVQLAAMAGPPPAPPPPPPAPESAGITTGTVMKWLVATVGTAVSTCLATQCWRAKAETP